MVKEYFSIIEAARHRGVSREAIYAAVKAKRLPFTKEKNRIKIHIDDLKRYDQNLHSRIVPEKFRDSCFTVSQMSKEFNVPKGKIYHFLRYDILKHIKVGAAYYILRFENQDAFTRLGITCPLPS